MTQSYDPERQVPVDFIDRPGMPADAEALATLTNMAQAARHNQTVADLSDEVERIRDLLNQPSTWSRLVFNGDELVAYDLGYPSQPVANMPADLRREHLDSLMVHPGYWGRGLASELIDRRIEDLREQGVIEVELWTEEDNNRSRALYEHKGWQSTGFQRLHPRSGELQAHYLLVLQTILS